MTAPGPDVPLPALRSRLEAVPAEEDGQPVYLLRDLEELSESSVALSGGGVFLASLFDGKRTAETLRELFVQGTGSEIKVETILELARALEDAGYLETPALAERRRKALEAFRASGRRPAVFAGPSYPAEPPVLSHRLSDFFTAERGPGKPAAESPDKPAPLGLVAPHIDFGRGGPSYAWSYRALSERRPPDVVVSFGVAHVSPDTPWIFTPKAYETPFGALEVDAPLYDALADKVWYDPRADEWAHKNEHSLEFQAVWLKYLWREKTPPWVPILVSSFERFSPDEVPSKAAALDKAIRDFAGVLKEQQDAGRRVTILAGIDLAHVGRRFGDELELTPDLERKIEAEDRRSLVDALALDADGFYRSAVGDGAWRKVCGLSALYTSVRLIKELGGASAAPGRLLSYGQAPDPAGGIVSFASAVFDPKG
ncbi:MAG: AmmeMemoRadiSam system protein B [Elusimicrobia bacterium]|nr:AmmeMemoRadiSam system protein B [Elusimicrobiota bacterium]